ncbi:Protein of unknown function [Variovorax sp. YR750]|jgi:hypothetical protein|uniref:phage protein NinX family protein n=1 Tax=Variovorax sp. YR750 TaxID=1884384 RepID=UPI0008C07DB8|nr:phage protein NinX family protein [Variovorax sp. YR750]MDP9605880.1 hypothetical protein [Variovorax paradoxus]SEL97445.1 Protein of unknown function [Variovorax sp. YR750]
MLPFLVPAPGSFPEEWLVMRVSEVNGAELDYWVARALGMMPTILRPQGRPSCFVIPAKREAFSFAPSSMWSDGGPIIDRERISFRWDGFGATRWCIAVKQGFRTVEANGETLLVAAMRAVVIDQFGDLELHPVKLPREGSY